MKYRIHQETLFDLARYAAETGFCGALNDWLEEQTGINWEIGDCHITVTGRILQCRDEAKLRLRGPHVPTTRGTVLCMNYPDNLGHWDTLTLQPNGYYEGDWSDENM